MNLKTFLTFNHALDETLMHTVHREAFQIYGKLLEGRKQLISSKLFYRR